MRNSRVAMLMAMAGAMSMASPSISVEIGRPDVDAEVYSLRSLGIRSGGGHPAPKASQAKKRRNARRMHCGHIKNLRLRA
jgi:hypothetical protein